MLPEALSVYSEQSYVLGALLPAVTRLTVHRRRQLTLRSGRHQLAKEARTDNVVTWDRIFEDCESF
eukprot:672670-Pyramimonas_sp.AAC.1